MKRTSASIYIGFTLLLLVQSSCVNWAARAVEKIPEETALHKNYTYDGKVIIIGAGASGLAAAKVLEKNKIEYIILEATDRYGGRLKKDTTLADFPIDLGAEWIHSNPKVLNALKGKKENQIDEELIPYHLNETGNWDGKEYKVNPARINNFMYHFMPESKFKTSTWYDFVDSNIAKTVKHKIVFNAPVVNINYEGSGVIVKTANGKSYQADKVLVTVSIGVLKSGNIGFKPAMNKRKIDAIESINFLTGFKAVMKFSEKFYPDALTWEVNDGEKVFYDISFKKNSKTDILGFLCTGPAANMYFDMESNDEVVKSLLMELDKIFDGQATTFFSGEYLIENWGQYEFTRGTWTQAFQEKTSALKILNESLNEKVYFAGEICDPYKQMGVPGAILSGYHSIDKLLISND